jgi:tetratricopeptide (TPR) repeat protein
MLLVTLAVSGRALAARASLNMGILLVSRTMNGAADAAQSRLEQASAWLERAANLGRGLQSEPGAQAALAIIAERDGYAHAVDVWRAAGYDAPELAFAGRELFRDRAFVQATPWFERAAAAAPQDPERWLDLGLCYARQKRWRMALDAYERGAQQVLPQADGLSSVYVQIALVRALHLDPADPSGALQAYDAALAADAWRDEREHLEALLNRGALLIGMERRDDAIANYEAALQLSPRHYVALYQVGRLYWSVRGDVAAAERALLAAIEVRPTDKRAILRLAAIYARTGRNEQAAEMYRRVLSLDPKDKAARVALKRLESI